MASIVLIHGAWMSPASWAPWVLRYEALGHNVIAPSWPHDERPVELPEFADLAARSYVYDTSGTEIAAYEV